jgi:hypothetical protein
MLDFMENVQNAFYEASHWNVDNSYGALNATARGRSHLSIPSQGILTGTPQHYSTSRHQRA